MKKRRLLGIVLSLCMVLALVPQMVFADETATYDLWQVGDKIYYAETGTCTDFTNAKGGTELPQGDYNFAYKLPYSGTYVLKTDITMTQSKPQIHISTSDITLDLNGKVMTKYSGDRYILRIEANNATIQDSNGVGAINGIIDIFGINSSLTLNSGTIEEISCSGGTLYADGGTVSEADTNGANGTITQHTGTTGTTITGDVNNGCAQYGTISGGIFYGEVVNGGSSKTSIISNGVFYGKVVNAYMSNITGGVFHEEVKNCGTITGGVFYDKVVNIKEYSNIGTINSGVFYGGIVEQGGKINGQYHTVSFDLNGVEGSIPEQYFVGTNEAQALEPADPAKEGYDFTGWYTDKELTKLYDFGSNVTGDLTLYAGFKQHALTVPFTTTVEVSGNASPGETTFNLEVVDSQGNELQHDDVEITASVKTDGAGNYDGELSFIGTDHEILNLFAEACDEEGYIYVKQADINDSNWDVDKAVWGLSHRGVTELSDEEVEPSPIYIFPAINDGTSYIVKAGENNVDKMTFINTYTKSVANPSDTEGTTNGDSDNDNKIAKTGDDTNLALWLALMLLSGAGITGVTAYARRKRTNE